jgi:hypothetical protein
MPSVIAILCGSLVGTAVARAQTSPPNKAQTKASPKGKHPSHTTSRTAPVTPAAPKATPPKPPPVVAATAAATIASPPAAGALASSAVLDLRDAPDGKALGTIAPATPVTPLARDRGWVRVRVDGWIKDVGLAPSSATVGALSAADLRADPQAAHGAVVRWDVQILALAHADALHRDLALDEPYLLARGPGAENALLYVAIPPALLQAATTLTTVAPVTATIVATVRNGKSAPLGVPILDAQSLARR